MEADLQRFYQVDYRDRWRGDLTLRRLLVLVTHLPPESATAGLMRDGKPMWTGEMHLLDDLRMAMTTSTKHKSKPHPQRPKATAKRRKDSPERRRKLTAARKRAADRREKIASGEIK